MSAAIEGNVWEAPKAPLHPAADGGPRCGDWLVCGGSIWVVALVAATALALNDPLRTAAQVPLMVVVGVFFVAAVAVILVALWHLTVAVLSPLVRLVCRTDP